MVTRFGGVQRGGLLESEHAPILSRAAESANLYLAVLAQLIQGRRGVPDGGPAIGVGHGGLLIELAQALREQGETHRGIRERPAVLIQHRNLHRDLAHAVGTHSVGEFDFYAGGPVRDGNGILAISGRCIPRVEGQRSVLQVLDAPAGSAGIGGIVGAGDIVPPVVAQIDEAVFRDGEQPRCDGVILEAVVPDCQAGVGFGVQSAGEIERGGTVLPQVALDRVAGDGAAGVAAARGGKGAPHVDAAVHDVLGDGDRRRPTERKPAVDDVLVCRELRTFLADVQAAVDLVVDERGVRTAVNLDGPAVPATVDEITFGVGGGGVIVARIVVGDHQRAAGDCVAQERNTGGIFVHGDVTRNDVFLQLRTVARFHAAGEVVVAGQCIAAQRELPGDGVVFQRGCALPRRLPGDTVETGGGIVVHGYGLEDVVFQCGVAVSLGVAQRVVRRGAVATQVHIRFPGVVLHGNNAGRIRRVDCTVPSERVAADVHRTVTIDGDGAVFIRGRMAYPARAPRRG